MIRRYDPELDYQTISHWYSLRGMPSVSQEMIPGIGFIKEGCAAGFLYLTDTKLAIIDLFISNPESRKEQRDDALDGIVEDLIKEAKIWGVKGILATSALRAIEARALAFDFKYTGTVKSFFLKL